MFLSNKLKKVNGTRDPFPPFMANAIKNFHFLGTHPLERGHLLFVNLLKIIFLLCSACNCLVVDLRRSGNVLC